MATPLELLIVALAFSIVGTFVMGCRHMINSGEQQDAAPAKPAQAPSNNQNHSAGTRHAHA